MGKQTGKKKRRGSKGEEADTQASVLPDIHGMAPSQEAEPEPEPEPEEPPDAGEDWDANAREVEAAIVPPPPGGSCGCGESLRVEMLDSTGQPTGQIRTFGYKTATAQVSAKRARYVD